MQQTNRSSLHLRRFYLCMGSIWFALRTAQGFQLVKVHNGHHAPRQLHHALALEVAQHPCDDFPVGAQMIGDGLMGEQQHAGALDACLLHQKGGQPPVKACPHHLFNQPHDLGKAAGDQLIGVICHGCRLGHEAAV